MTEHFCIEFRFFIEGEGIGPARRMYAYASCLAIPAPSCRGMPSAWIMGATHYILSLLPPLPPSHIAKRCPYILETLNQSKKAMHCGAWLLL